MHASRVIKVWSIVVVNKLYDHTDFIKTSALLATAISIGGVAMACTE